MATILVADDNRANREAMVALLETAGHTVATAADGGEAFARALELRPALVIADVLMPRMDGYELARRLHLEPATAKTAVMFYTAYFGTREARELALAHGVARVLVKPSDNDAILAAVQEVLSSQAPPRAVPPGLDREHLRVMVDELLDKTGALEAQQRRVQRLNRTLSVLSAVNALIVRATEPQALLEEACRIAVEAGGFRLAAVGLLDRRTQSLRPAAAAGEGSAERDLARLKPGTRALIWNDVESGSFVALPLVVTGATAGALLLYARARDFFDEEEMRLLQELAGDISFALHHLEQKARMDYLAYHDSITELPNRSLFMDRMGQALSAARREKRFAAAVFLDIARFRMVNETLGRKSGDELLRQVGERLRREVARDEDTVARVGGDHFAIAVAGFGNAAEATHGLIDRLDAAFARPFVLEGVELRVSLKAGVAVFPADGETTEELCAHAESALKHAKDSEQRFLFYAPEMNARVAEALAMENRLRRAIEGGRLALHYQPKIDVQTGGLAGLEALIRWNDPELGAVPPAKFVSLMEETGMILAAGGWALRRAVEDIRRWRAVGLAVPRVSVNVSAIQLRQKDFVEAVLAAVGPDQGEPLLEIEITESVLVEDIEESTRKLQTLRSAGIEVAVDDFGTGYCSLGYLARLPVDTLKVDRSFVVRIGEAGTPRNIVAMIVSLAHTLGLKVIAEGVEDDAQVRLLRELGCDQIQGFYVSHPVPPEGVEALLRPGWQGGRRVAASAA